MVPKAAVFKYGRSAKSFNRGPGGTPLHQPPWNTSWGMSL